MGTDIFRVTQDYRDLRSIYAQVYTEHVVFDLIRKLHLKYIFNEILNQKFPFLLVLSQRFGHAFYLCLSKGHNPSGRPYWR